MCRSGRLHSVLCCDREQGVSWGLPTCCMLLLSYSRSLQQVLKGHCVGLSTEIETKRAERLIQEGQCETAELLTVGLARVGAAPGCPFPSTCTGAMLEAAALGICPCGGQELQLCSPSVGFSGRHSRGICTFCLSCWHFIFWLKG